MSGLSHVSARRAAVRPAHVAESAQVEPGSTCGPSTQVWDLATVREGASIGAECVIGRGAYIGPGVVVGDRVKIQSQALIYEPAVLEDGAFVGPAVVFTNDTYPRAVNPDGSLKTGGDWTAVGVTVREGAAIGARAVCVAPVTIGRWASVGAGSVVTRDVPDHALVVGTPARQVGWVGRSGVPLVSDTRDRWICPVSGEVYVQVDGRLEDAR